jgi:hypothetical protein
MNYLIGNKKDGIINLREILYYWILFLMIVYTFKGIIALINNEQFINLI